MKERKGGLSEIQILHESPSIASLTNYIYVSRKNIVDIQKWVTEKVGNVLFYYTVIYISL